MSPPGLPHWRSGHCRLGRQYLNPDQSVTADLSVVFGLNLFAKGSPEADYTVRIVLQAQLLKNSAYYLKVFSLGDNAFHERAQDRECDKVEGHVYDDKSKELHPKLCIALKSVKRLGQGIVKDAH